jgi:hypothetical protein
VVNIGGVGSSPHPQDRCRARMTHARLRRSLDEPTKRARRVLLMPVSTALLRRFDELSRDDVDIDAVDRARRLVASAERRVMLDAARAR